MKLYIAHKHKEYGSTPENYVWAGVERDPRFFIPSSQR